MDSYYYSVGANVFVLSKLFVAFWKLKICFCLFLHKLFKLFVAIVINVLFILFSIV